VKKEAWKAVNGHSGADGFEAFVGVGSNVDPEKNILSALPEILSSLEVVEASRFYRNPAFSPDRRDLPPFVNGVLKVRTNHAPRDLKYGVLRNIEGMVNRRRTGDRFSPRTLDLDLLVYGDLEVDSEDLVLPDPDISVHPFWAVPLAELLPEFCPPKSPLPLKELVHTLEAGSMVYLESFTERVHHTLLLPAGHSGSR
jgi:dihydroneopterin aldolase/2-amino-4-hydroxy-6-hydroxymethyldihydropteridine diphosphokinase